MSFFLQFALYLTGGRSASLHGSLFLVRCRRRFQDVQSRPRSVPPAARRNPDSRRHRHRHRHRRRRRRPGLFRTVIRA